MKTLPLIRALFTISALYDGVLGGAFLLAAPAIFDQFNVLPPSHWGYIQFPAALLLIFAIMFAALAIAPQRNCNLIPYGALLKISYSGLVFYHWIAEGIPDMWKPWAFADIAFFVLFIWAYFQLRSTAADSASHRQSALNHA